VSDPLWDSINRKRKGGRDPLVRAFDLLDAAGEREPTKAMKRADRELAAATTHGDPEAVLMTSYILVKYGRARPARAILRARGDLCRLHGDLAYMRGEAELRGGYGLPAAIMGRAWGRRARELGVSSTVKLTPLRQDAQAQVLLVVGLVLAAVAAAFRPLGRSWRGIGAVAGIAIALPGLLRQLAFHRVWAVVLVGVFVVLTGLALR
jgi:hypothetical protein